MCAGYISQYGNFSRIRLIVMENKENFMLKFHCKHFSYSNVVGVYDINYNNR